MRFAPHQPIMNRDTKEPLTEPGRTVTHGLVAIRALDAKFPDDTASAEVRYARFVLATRILSASNTIDLTIEEAAMIKEAVAKAYPPGIFGQVWLALNEAAKAPTVAAA